MKVKIFRYDRKSGYCYECGHDSSLLIGVSDWLEIDRETYVKLNHAVGWHSISDKNYKYILIEDFSNETTVNEIIRDANKFIEDTERKRKESENKIKTLKKKKEEKKQERELKKLAELKRKYEKV